MGYTKLMLSLFLIVGAMLFIGSLSFAQDEGKLRIHFIDVGYGDAFFVEFPGGENLLIDGGDRKAAGHLLDYLKSLAVSKIDTLVITHPHANHYFNFP